MKSRTTAAMLALFLGTFGVHRYYLGQTGLGLFYFFSSFIFGGIFRLPFGAVLGIIDAMSFFFMSDEEFDRRYNKDKTEGSTRRTRSTTRSRTPRSTRGDQRTTRQASRTADRDRVEAQNSRKKNVTRRNPFKLSGKKKLTAYDLKGAIEDFNRSLDITPDDQETHYMIASAYSLNENADKAFDHLTMAVANGLKDYEKIKNDDALAYLRIHPDFEAFEKAGYRKSNPLQSSASQPEKANDTLLAQLQRLAEMRKKGLITDEDFEIEKRRIMR